MVWQEYSPKWTVKAVKNCIPIEVGSGWLFVRITVRKVHLSIFLTAFFDIFGVIEQYLGAQIEQGSDYRLKGGGAVK